MPQNNEEHMCSVCGKPLQIEKCPECQGTGEVGYFFFWEKECPACKGIGTIFRCPDELNYDHMMVELGIDDSDDITAEPDIRFTPLSKEKIVPSPKQRCPVCNGTGVMKYAGMMAPCSNCRPIEFNEWRNRSIPPPGWGH